MSPNAVGKLKDPAASQDRGAYIQSNQTNLI